MAGRARRRPIRFRPKGVPHALAARPSPSSDPDVFRQVFLDRQYAPFDGLQRVESILDLGANVGYSSAYFLARFPNAKVLAVEPDADNYEMCLRNLAPYGPRVRVKQGAVWRKTATLYTVGDYGDNRNWAVAVRETPGEGSTAVQAWDVESLLDEVAGSRPLDILKIDIEGSELALFEERPKWLRRVRNLCVELHGEDCEESFDRAMSAYEYERENWGELVMCRDIRPRKK